MDTLEKLKADYKVERAKFSEACESCSSTLHPNAFRDMKIIEERIEKLHNASGLMFDALLSIIEETPTNQMKKPKMQKALEAIAFAKYGDRK